MPDEKFDEKEREKHEEKSVEEKSRRDPLSGIIWAAILIWAGLVFLASNLGYLDRFLGSRRGISGLPFGLDAWSLILIGAGMILLFEAAVRLLVPEYRRPIGGTLFFGFLLIGIGLGDLFNWNIFWPMVLIALGLSIILRSMRRER